MVVYSFVVSNDLGLRVRGGCRETTRGHSWTMTVIKVDLTGLVPPSMEVKNECSKRRQVERLSVLLRVLFYFNFIVSDRATECGH